MGLDSSVLTSQDILRLNKETSLKENDIKKCYQKFMALDKEKKGFVSVTDLANIPEFQNNPLRYHIAQYMLNKKDNESINFESFIKIMDIFKSDNTEKQYKFMYEIFDFDKDGKLSSEDMVINFKLLLGNSLNEEQILEIVDKTISDFSSDQKYIYYNDFVKMMNEF